jgi:hypothetical protein
MHSSSMLSQTYLLTTEQNPVVKARRILSTADVQTHAWRGKRKPQGENPVKVLVQAESHLLTMVLAALSPDVTQGSVLVV